MRQTDITNYLALSYPMLRQIVSQVILYLIIIILDFLNCTKNLIMYHPNYRKTVSIDSFQSVMIKRAYRVVVDKRH